MEEIHGPDGATLPAPWPPALCSGGFGQCFANAYDWNAATLGDPADEGAGYALHVITLPTRTGQ